MLSCSVFIYPIFLELLKSCAILPLEMETEPTLLFKIFDLILQIIVYFVVMGVFGFLCFLVNCFIEEGRRGSRGIFGGWSGGGD